MKPSTGDYATLCIIVSLSLFVAGGLVLFDSGTDPLQNVEVSEQELTCSCEPVKTELPHREDPSPKYCGRDVLKQETEGCPEWAIYLVCKAPIWQAHDILWTKNFVFGDLSAVEEFEAEGLAAGGKYSKLCYVYYDSNGPSRVVLERVDGPSSFTLSLLLLLFAGTSIAFPCYYVVIQKRQLLDTVHDLDSFDPKHHLVINIEQSEPVNPYGTFFRKMSQ